jgi:hypothetical protein
MGIFEMGWEKPSPIQVRLTGSLSAQRWPVWNWGIPLL